MRRKEDRCGRGAVAVEFALVLGPLLLVVLGAIDWGWYFYVREVVANAAREGARAGAINPGNEVGVANSYLQSSNLSQVAASCSDANSACIQITYASGSITGFLVSGVTIPANASARAVMRKE
jgi:hypothetical protein